MSVTITQNKQKKPSLLVHKTIEELTKSTPPEMRNRKSGNRDPKSPRKDTPNKALT
jgi:hypothetical protein